MTCCRGARTLVSHKPLPLTLPSLSSRAFALAHARMPKGLVLSALEQWARYHVSYVADTPSSGMLHVAARA